MTANRAKLGLALGLVLGIGTASSPAFGKSQRQPLFKTSAPASLARAAAEAPDTLEVFCLYVNFADETDLEDDPSTTGTGHFGTAGSGKGDPDKKQAYTLDPNGILRSHRFYLEKHFEFARNYFERVSNGRVTVVPRIFPTPNASGKVEPYTLSGRMKKYNPSELDRDSKQKISDFNEERGQRLMAFVVESIKAADKSEDKSQNPFRTAHEDSLADPLNKKKHRCYLIFHAGHSRLLDGGQLGAFGANTPNDFTDFYVTKDDFSLLDSATTNAKKGGTPDVDKRAAAKGVKVSTGDTVDNIMMLSEAASQDKVNWGINGILINQLARQMGMPDMFDVVKGISQLGFFDVMDFAGYNTLNGFLPVYPSAWVRAYMGWDEPVVAKAGTGPFSEYKLWSPTARPEAGRATTVKIPINDREYFLVENRQRAAGDTTVTIYYSERAGDGDLAFTKNGSKTVKFSQVDSIFLDSIPDPSKPDSKPRKMMVNPLKPNGVITGASSYDLGLPSSGMLVWHVNEWFISQFLKEGAVNAYLGDTLKSQYKGLELVEADGSLSIGKEFKDQLGQPAFDYGSGSDMLPHVRVKRVNPPKDTSWSKTRDTLDAIGPYGAANTNAWNDGRTHLRLEAVVPSNPRLEPGMSSFSGDSIYNVRDSVLTLRVVWPDNKTVSQDPKWAWPVKLDPGGHPQSLNVLKSPGGGRYVVALSDRGYAQTFTAEGTTAMDPDTTFKGKPGYDSVRTLLPSGLTRDTSTVPITSLAGRLGGPLGSAASGDSVMAVLTADRITFLKLRPAGLAARSRDSSAETVSIAAPGQAGPIVAGDRVWILTRAHRAVAFTPAGAPVDSIDLPDLEYQGLAAFPNGAGSGKPMSLAAAAKGGAVVLINADARLAIRLEKAWGNEAPGKDESFTVSAADFDRDGAVDLFLLGSKGAATLFKIGGGAAVQVFAGFPQRFPRSVHFLDTLYETKNGARKLSRIIDFNSDDASAPALADLDGDRHPDILFSATNSVFAIDYHGAVLKGWPFLLEDRQNVGFAYGNPLHPETAVRSSPLALSLGGHATVLIGSPDGLILAVDSLGKRVRSSSFEASRNRRGGILASDVADWPLTMGGLTLDSNDNPYIHLSAVDLDADGNLELLAQSGSGSLNAWTLKQSATPQGQSWTMPGGDAARRNFLDVSGWSAAPAAGTAESIQEFHLFPSPVRGPTATVHLRIGAAAQKARIRVYDIAGVVVRDVKWENLTEGLQAFNQVLDLRNVAPDVYSAQVEVWFPGGKQKKWVRFGVIK
ncbi:MAG: repeat protein [Fibrobacteres bacterium]|nr:repeat protein [Fibrobacterota bacterium]